MISQTQYYPIALSLKNKLALVVGGGQVAGRKIEGLLKVSAQIKVISPKVTLAIKHLAVKGKIKWAKRPVRVSDISNADIIIAATSDRAVNKKISLWAKKRKILVNVVDQPGLSSFISPAVLRAMKTVVAVYTNGRDPVLSRDLRNFLKEHWDVFLSYRNKL